MVVAFVSKNLGQTLVPCSTVPVPLVPFKKRFAMETMAMLSDNSSTNGQLSMG